MAKHCGYVVEIKNLEKHPNADRLMITTLFMENVIVSTDVQIGDIGVYFPSDLQLSVDFCDNNHLCRANSKGEKDSGYMDPNKRNVKAIKLRGAFSDGIYCPITCLDYVYDDHDAASHLSVGDIIDTVNGIEICKKYIPRRNTPSVAKVKQHYNQKKTDKEQTPYFAEHIDTPQLRFCADTFKPGDIICLTEKVHGTSSRNANTLTISYKKNWLDKLLHRKGKMVTSYKYIVGTRRTTVQNPEDGYYHDNNFRIEWGKKFIGKLRQGEEVFGEIAGFIAPGTPVMGVVQNSKVSDKNFSKRYGATTTFSYGCAEDGSKPLNRYFIYRMTYTTPEGDVIEYPWDMVKMRAEQLGFEVVPELDRFMYTTEEDFYAHINKWLDIPSTIDQSHVIEGVVIRALNKPNFCVAKEKSINFKILEGILKDEAVAPDIEEAEELIEELE